MTNAMVGLRNNIAILEMLEEDISEAKQSYKKSRSKKRKAILDDAVAELLTHVDEMLAPTVPFWNAVASMHDGVVIGRSYSAGSVFLDQYSVEDKYFFRVYANYTIGEIQLFYYTKLNGLKTKRVEAPILDTASNMETVYVELETMDEANEMLWKTFYDEKPMMLAITVKHPDAVKEG